MKYSLSFNGHYKTLNVDEIKCLNNQLGAIFNYVKEHPEKRINIRWNEKKEITEKYLKEINFIKETAEDYTISCDTIATLQTLKDKGYNVYYNYPVTDWDSFSQLLDFGVSDIWIDGPLGFQMDKIFIAKKTGVKIRVSPVLTSGGEGPTAFFIRPEDLYRYEDYIDYIDFQVQETEREEVLLKIYQQGAWLLTTEELIPHSKIKNINTLIGKNFGTYRLNCGQKCRIPGRQCYLCKTYLDFSEAAVEALKSQN